jgi:hypothetical protein
VGLKPFAVIVFIEIFEKGERFFRKHKLEQEYSAN